MSDKPTNDDVWEAHARLCNAEQIITMAHRNMLATGECWEESEAIEGALKLLGGVYVILGNALNRLPELEKEAQP